MHFKKKPLVVAVFTALTLSQTTFADIEYTGTHSEISQLVDSDINVGIIISDATVGTLDIDVQAGKTIADSVGIIDSTVDTAYIENNGGNIQAVFDGVEPLANNGIIISGSTVTGWDSEEVIGVKELIVNTGDIDSAPTAGNGIKIVDSTVTGSIINENSDTQGGSINGAEAAIAIHDSIFNGNIYNQDEVADTATPPTEETAGITAITGSEFGIDILNSTFNGFIENSGYIEASDEGNPDVGQAINIESSTVTGNITNSGHVVAQQSGIQIIADSDNLTARSTFNGDINNSGYITAGKQAVKIATSDMTGDIINSGSIEGDDRGVDLFSANFSGDITNSGTIKSDGDNESLYTGRGINLFESTFTGDINNSGAIIGGTGDKGRGISIGETLFVGDINNHGTINATRGISLTDDMTLTGNILNTGSITATTQAILMGSSEMVGNITNSGTLSGARAVELTSGAVFLGDFTNSGVITGSDRGINLYQATFTGDINNSGTITGGSDELDRGLSVNTTVFNGEINNTGDISGYRGISITEDVTGSLTINQMGGTISGISHGVLLTGHRMNYTGGNIVGKVSNAGGTVYIEGNRTIDGDYDQDSEATLAFGLHKESSLTADNITLAAGSKVLLDLSKGDLYVSKGSSIELLKVQDGGVITSSGVDFSVSNSLVSIADIQNINGKLVVTFEKDSFEEAVQTLIKAGTVQGQGAANAQKVVTVLQKLEPLATNNPVIAQLLNQVDSTNMANLLPDVSGSATGSATVAANTSGGIVTGRSRAVASGDTFAKQGMWLQALYADAEQDDRSGISGYAATTSGLVLGADGETDSGAVYGVAYTFSTTDTDTNNNISSTDTDYHQLTGYWGYSLGNILMDGQVFYGRGNNDARRIGIGGNALADYDTNQYGIQLSSGYQLGLSNEVQLTPRVSVDYTRLDVDAYNETGSAAGLLSVDKQKLDRLELGLSMDASKTFQTAEMLVTPRVTLGVFHDFEAETQSITAAFQSAPDTSFTSQGADAEKARYLAAVGVEFAKGDNLTATVEYNYNWQDHFDAHTGAVKLRWEF